VFKRNVCMNYNRGNCRFGDKCRKEHICSYFLKGSCKYGAGCRLNHNLPSSSPGHRRRASRAPTEGVCGWGWKRILRNSTFLFKYGYCIIQYSIKSKRNLNEKAFPHVLLLIYPVIITHTCNYLRI